MLGKIKERYWLYHKKRCQDDALALPENRDFSNFVLKQKELVQSRLDAGDLPSDKESLTTALDWIYGAQHATPDGGVSLGYFPLSEHGGWMPSYPETTGYIITTLLKYAKLYSSEEALDAALRMADWELDVQMPSGAVQGGFLCSPKNQAAAAFNTGMVMDGWISAFEATNEKRYLGGAIRAAEFLLNDINSEGYFRTNGDFVHGDVVKVYNCLCAWAMYRAGVAGEQPELIKAAHRVVKAALAKRNKAGWFENNCLTHSDEPLTHTIGYTLQGIFEVGVLSGDEVYIGAVRESLAAVLASVEADGYLAARFDKRWRPTKKYVCLTGSAQLAILCFRFYEEFGVDQYLDSGRRLVRFIKATQLVTGKNSAMVGAIGGSYPLMGDYMTAGYPNWATKYFIDALLLQEVTES